MGLIQMQGTGEVSERRWDLSAQLIAVEIPVKWATSDMLIVRRERIRTDTTAAHS